MKSIKPTLSIVIATKNRIPYCINVIQTILSFKDEDFELIIQDNSDLLELKEYAHRITDKRFKYNYTPPPFSSIDNFNAAIGIASGEYICLIGDDDGINPEIFKIVRWAGKNNIDSIVPGLNVIYWWPDTTSELINRKNDNGILEISKITGEINSFNTTIGLNKLMKNGGLDYLNLNLPKLYHGIVKKEYLDNIKAITGNYIGGLSPDIYAAVALTRYIDNIITIDFPLTIPGICIQSTSADAATKKNIGKLEDAPHFRDRGVYFWSRQVPRYYTNLTIWADSAIASLTDMKRPELLSKFNVTALTVKCLKRDKEYSNTIIENYLAHKNVTYHLQKWYFLRLLWFKTHQYRLLDLFHRVIIKSKRIGTSIVGVGKTKNINQIKIKNVENISQAINELTKYLSNQPLSVDDILNRLDIRFGNSAVERKNTTAKKQKFLSK